MLTLTPLSKNAIFDKCKVQLCKAAQIANKLLIISPLQKHIVLASVSLFSLFLYESSKLTIYFPLACHADFFSSSIMGSYYR